MPTQFVVGGELENFGGTGAVGGARYAETTLRLSRVIELGGKREARQALGTAEVLRQRNLADTAKLEIASRTTARYVARPEEHTSGLQSLMSNSYAVFCLKKKHICRLSIE